ncbi:hypothetical protein ACJIZ3_024382 [Penstemon smallii]|uniref:BZIP domain-containing protein n=1 Tax=Penstemon smallii TaxID=265156 RepID=A0ABD3TTC0_9LAMI
MDIECGAAVSEEDDELEAAAALAGLARPSVGRMGGSSSSASFQDRTTAVQHTVTAPGKSDQTFSNTASELCSASNQSNPANKSKQILNEAEKEERRLRRILANRESARQTIRRRQAMFLELTSKAAELSEENENLKKKKELAVKEYNTLKTRNEFLKAQMAKIKHEEPKPSSSTPNFLRDHQPSLVPCFWPSDVFQFQYPPQFHPNVMTSPQFLMPNTSNTRPATPVFVMQVPWLLPFVPPNSTFQSHDIQNETSSSRTMSMGSIDGARLSAPHDSGAHYTAHHNHPGGTSVFVPQPQSNAGPVESIRPAGNSSINYTTHEEPVIHLHKSSEDAVVEAEARRRRKELMKLKNIHGHHAHTHHRR